MFKRCGFEAVRARTVSAGGIAEHVVEAMEEPDGPGKREGAATAEGPATAEGGWEQLLRAGVVAGAAGGVTGARVRLQLHARVRLQRRARVRVQRRARVCVCDCSGVHVCACARCPRAHLPRPCVTVCSG